MLDEARIKELEEKVAKSKEIFKQAYDRFKPEDMRLIWSGGKDSTLLLFIIKEACSSRFSRAGA